MIRLNILFYRLFGKRLKLSIDTVEVDLYEAMLADDHIDIKNFHSRADHYRYNDDSGPYKEYCKMLKKRRNWYLRHGFFDLAEDIQTAFWMDKD